MNFVKNGYDNLDQLRSVTTEELAGWWGGGGRGGVGTF